MGGEGVVFNCVYLGLTDRMYGLMIAAAISTKAMSAWIPVKTVYQGGLLLQFLRYLFRVQTLPQSSVCEEEESVC